jgi:hypothetical protein
VTAPDQVRLLREIVTAPAATLVVDVEAVGLGWPAAVLAQAGLLRRGDGPAGAVWEPTRAGLEIVARLSEVAS